MDVGADEFEQSLPLLQELVAGADFVGKVPGVAGPVRDTLGTGVWCVCVRMGLQARGAQRVTLGRRGDFLSHSGRRAEGIKPPALDSPVCDHTSCSFSITVYICVLP